MQRSTGFRRGMTALAAALALPATALAGIGALGTPAAAAPAAQARVRAVPADRAYPVLVDGFTAKGTGALLDIGPTWKKKFSLRGSPGGIAIARNGRTGYVVDGSKIAVLRRLNTAHPRMTQVRVGNSSLTPTDVAVTPNGAFLYVTFTQNTATASHGKIRVYRGAATGRLRLAATLTAGLSASHPVITPDGRYAYVADQIYHGYTEISGVRTAHPRVIAHTAGPQGFNGNLYGLTISPNGRYLYAGSGNLYFGVIEVFRNAESAHPAYVRSFSLSSAAGGVLITPNGRWGYAPYYPGRVLVIKNAQARPAKARTMKLPGAASPDAVQPGGRYAFAASGQYGKPGRILVLAGVSGGHPKVRATWRVPFSPFVIAVSPVR